MKFLFAPLIIFLISCHQTNPPVENYYFPVKDFFETKTDCFVNQNDTTDKMYWQMKTFVNDADTFFQTKEYDAKNRITDDIVEKVCNGNSIMRSWILFNYDSSGNKFAIQTKVLDSIVFNPLQKEGESIHFKISFKDALSPNIFSISKERTLVGISENQEIFSDQIKLYRNETRKINEFKATTVYEKNKGLVSYKMYLINGKVKDFVLTSRK